MTKYKLKFFEGDGIAAGGTWTIHWTADADYVIRAILVNRADGGSWTRSTCTIHIAKDPLTVDKCLVLTLGRDWLYRLPLEEPLGKDQDFDMVITNLEGTALDIRVTLVLEKR